MTRFENEATQGKILSSVPNNVLLKSFRRQTVLVTYCSSIREAQDFLF